MKNPWLKLPQHAPFILHEDEKIIQNFNKRYDDINYQIITNMYPEPFIGSLNANVILLNLNPGFGGEQDLEVHNKKDKFTETIKDNLSHSLKDNPFYFLDPQFAYTPGYAWWTKKLKSLIIEVGQDVVAKNLLCIELFPYHSRKYRFTAQLPSQEYTKFLVKSAINRNAIIIGMRAIRKWLDLLPELQKYHSFYKLNNPQNVSVSRNNCPEGFDKIINKIRIE
jgi:hypothetical protein